MKREVYLKMKERISVCTNEEIRQEHEAKWGKLQEGVVLYYFDSSGLLDDGDIVPSIIHSIKSQNMWNVCQRFYSFLIQICPDAEKQLLTAKTN